MAWTRKGDRIAYLARSRQAGLTAPTAVHMMDPLRPESDRVLARLGGGEWSGPAFSEDGRSLALLERLSAHASRLWVMDAATGRRQRVGAGGNAPVDYGAARFSRDGKGLFATSDRGAPFRRLVYLPLSGDRERVLTGGIRRDVDDLRRSRSTRIASRSSPTRTAPTCCASSTCYPEGAAAPARSCDGVIDGLEWRRESRRGRLHRHLRALRRRRLLLRREGPTRSRAGPTATTPRSTRARFAEPRIVRWKSFDRARSRASSTSRRRASPAAAP